MRRSLRRWTSTSLSAPSHALPRRRSARSASTTSNPLPVPASIPTSSSRLTTPTTTPRRTHAFPDFDLHFLGSGAGASRARGAPSTLLNLGKESWLFDVGEGSVRQAVRSKKSVMEVTRIFITHCHGDHILGLPSLLMQVGTYSMGDASHPAASQPVHIYGPPGLHHYLCTVLRVTEASMSREVVVHEMMLSQADAQRVDSLGASLRWRRPWRAYNHEGLSEQQSVISSRRDFPNISKVQVFSSEQEGLWDLVDFAQGVKVQAGLILHRIPCFGFVVTEAETSGRLQMDRCDELGVTDYADFVRLKSGSSVLGPDGRVILSADVCGPPLKGRKVTILGDTSNASLLTQAAKDSDVLVHECTFDMSKESNAKKSGHATPQVAVKAFRSFSAKRLVLNHIGTQYVPEGRERGERGFQSNPGSANAGTGSAMRTDSVILEQARDYMDPSSRAHVILARDFETLKIPPGGFSADTETFLPSIPVRVNNKAPQRGRI